MKRYYLSTIVQNPDGQIVPAAALSGLNYVVTYPADDPQTGLPPIGGTALVLISGNNHGPVLSDQRNDPLPDFPLDGKVSAIQQATKANMRALLLRRGFNVQNAVDNADGFRDTIRSVGRSLDSRFDENNFDVN